MTKPHDENWELDGDGDVRRVSAKGRRTSLVCLRAATGTPESQRLASAAPDMARALIAGADIFDNGACWCDGGRRRHDTSHPFCSAARAALRKAGVIP